MTQTKISRQRLNQTSNERGLAMLETLPLLILFVLLISYAMGFYGVVQTGILNTIAARTYAFDTFRNRTDINHFRDNNIRNPADMEEEYFAPAGVRLHSVNSESELNSDETTASTRQIAIGMDVADENRTNTQLHNEGIYQIRTGTQNETYSASPVWVMSQYGICLNAQCGDN